MKRRLFFTLCLALLAAGAAAQTDIPAIDHAGSGPQITFSVKEHDFKQIPESGKKVSCDFVFTNTGDKPLVVTKAITSCKCTETSYTKKPVPPGGQGMVTVTYDPKKQQGVFHKAIQVYTNTPERMHIIIVKGEVVQR